MTMRPAAALPDGDAADARASALAPRELLLADAIAERVVAALTIEPARAPMVDAAAVASALGVTRDFVYTHARELGGERIGGGTRGRLRFDLDRALASVTSCSTSKESQAPQTPVATGGSPRRHHRRLGSSPELLPIRGSATPLDADEAS
jgi:hypothetical protein